MTIDPAQTARWPMDVLGLPQIRGYSQRSAEYLMRTDVQGGTPRYRYKDQAAMTNFSLRFLFTKAQMSEFEIFFANGLRFGLRWFRIPLSYGLGLIETTVHVTERYEATRIGTAWQVLLPVEADLTSILGVFGDAVVAIIDARTVSDPSPDTDQIDSEAPDSVQVIDEIIDVGNVTTLRVGLDLPPDLQPGDIPQYSPSRLSLKIGVSAVRSLPIRFPVELL